MSRCLQTFRGKPEHKRFHCGSKELRIAHTHSLIASLTEYLFSALRLQRVLVRVLLLQSGLRNPREQLVAAPRALLCVLIHRSPAHALGQDQQGDAGHTKAKPDVDHPVHRDGFS